MNKIDELIEKVNDLQADCNKIQEIVNKKMNSKRLEDIRNHKNMSNYRILKTMIIECLNSKDISYISMVLQLAEIIVDDAINHVNHNEDEDESDD